MGSALPAMVETVPSAVTWRSAKFRLSATSTWPWALMASPIGWLKRAAAPTPSVRPVAPGVPATVETVPSALTLRSVCAAASDTHKAPEASSARPAGSMNVALAAGPLAAPTAPEPA
ncbi:hypothetical protein D3C72_1307480 [compost metagenome]